MEEYIIESVRESSAALQQLLEPKSVAFMDEAAKLLAHCFRVGNKVIIAGNGGSLCDAAHFAEELTGQFRQKRKALPAIALTDSSHITCVGNDFGFDQIFARGVEAFGKEGDIFVGLSTSGNSKNIIYAFETAKALGLSTIAFLGKSGGMLKGFADLEISIDGFSTSDRIQEAHMAAIHIIIEMVEKYLFDNAVELMETLLLKEECTTP
ncbi:MAG: SIS domain-containing protein [Chlamydiales bacterium]|nr:SIS domain-containing protein [Chlamydiales bacterium]